MNISELFIRRPIGTSLLALGLMLIGIVAWRFLPVSSLPTVDLPTVRVQASRPGADPSTMAATVAAPLERRLGEISGVTELTSTSSLGSTGITIQFDLSRSIVGAARDVQAALNAAATDLPGDLPSLPTARKFNPAGAPILIIALTSDTLAPSAIYDIADSVIAQRMSQIEGVGDVSVAGAEQPAIRVRVDPSRLAAMGVSMDAVRTAIANANALTPLGQIDGPTRGATLSLNDQMTSPQDFGQLVLKNANGGHVFLSSVASIDASVRNNRSAATYNGKPSVILIVTKQADANVIDTVDRIRALLPELQRFIPAGLEISVVSDRTTTIRASVEDMQITLGITCLLVMAVVFLFLRRGTPTIAAGITVPLALAGTAASMWAAGYSVDNISLMALAVSVGFVVDDAIVILENIYSKLEEGLTPMRAAIEGARQIGFTVVSISLSLIAAFIPLLMMGGIIGRFFREFSWTLTFAIIVSTAVSLTVTPMICAHFIKRPPSRDERRIDRIVEGAMERMISFYARTLDIVLDHRLMTGFVFVAVIALTVALFIRVPKGSIPQDDTGLIFAFTEAATDSSFRAMNDLQQRAAAIIQADPAVASVASSVGGSGGGSTNSGRMFVGLKPIGERGLSAQRVIDRLRPQLGELAGIRVYMFASQDVRVGGRQGKSQYQFTLWDSDFEELVKYVPLVLDAVKTLPGLADVSTDREPNGLQANIVIDRQAASRLGVQIQDIDNSLNNAYSQRQISTIYTPRNQYRVVLDVPRNVQRDPADIGNLYVSGAGGVQLPLTSVARIDRTLAPLLVNHQGQFPAVTITFNLTADTLLEEGTDRVRAAVSAMHLPDTLHTEFAGDAKALTGQGASQGLLVGVALLAVYIVLGVLYESLAHPLTIISTLPSAGLGALVALQVANVELSLIAFIGIILLIGIVKKNGILLVDFALEAERRRGIAPRAAIRAACLERFRPILMTTLASLLGALPLLLATGAGSELRRPLGITIAGGLIVSQILTLYTTPVIYLALDKLHNRRWRRAKSPAAAPQPAE